MSIPVIFRKEYHEGENGKRNRKAWDIIAIFPTRAATDYPGDLYVYCPVAQGWKFPGGYTWTSASLEWYRQTDPATPAEYAALLEYLKSGDPLESDLTDLKVYRRLQPSFIEDRRDDIARIDLAYGLENGEMYSWGVWGYTPFRIARHSRWCGVAPANYSEESPDFYRAVEPNTQREEWKRFDTTDEALEYMASVTRLSNWRKVE